MAFADMAAAVSSLRNLLFDGPTDKMAYQKKCFGKVDGVNTLFKTFEYRRVTDFTVAPVNNFGVYKNGVLQAETAIATDDTASGHFTLVTPPAGSTGTGDVITASYYYQFFNDAELQQYITNAVQWLGLGTDPTTVPDGLVPSCLYFAGQEAYHMLAIRWSMRVSEIYQLEDAPDESVMALSDTYRKMSTDFNNKSMKLRDDYYGRQGQSLAPLFGVNAGAVRDYMPRR
jgi:hypothetical protein